MEFHHPFSPRYVICHCWYNPLKRVAFLAKRVWNCAFLTHECTSRFLITKRHEEDDLVSEDRSRVRVMKTTGWCRNSCLVASHTQAGVAWTDWCRHWTESMVKCCPNNGAIHVTRYVWISGLYSVASWRRLHTSNRMLAKFSPTHRARRVGCWENWRTGKESSLSVRALFCSSLHCRFYNWALKEASDRPISYVSPTSIY